MKQIQATEMYKGKEMEQEHGEPVSRHPRKHYIQVLAVHRQVGAT